MTTPVIAVIQYQFFGVSTHRHLVGALSIICSGVILSLYNDFEINMTGMFPFGVPMLRKYASICVGKCGN